MKVSAALLIGVLIACGPASSTPAPGPSLATPAPTVATTARDAVLALSDLSPGCGLTSERDDSWDAPSWEGYIQGWLAFYACPATSSRNIEVMAEATTYSSADGARTAVAVAREYHPAQDRIIDIPATDTLGDMFAFQNSITLLPGDVAYEVIFSGANMFHLVWVQGPAGTIDLSMALALAKKQLARAR